LAFTFGFCFGFTFGGGFRTENVSSPPLKIGWSGGSEPLLIILTMGLLLVD